MTRSFRNKQKTIISRIKGIIQNVKKVKVVFGHRADVQKEDGHLEITDKKVAVVSISPFNNNPVRDRY